VFYNNNNNNNNKHICIAPYGRNFRGAWKCSVFYVVHNNSKWVTWSNKHERVSETGVFPSRDRVPGTLCLLHCVTETSHLYSIRDFWRHFGLSGLRRIVTVAYLRRVQIFLLTYLLTWPRWRLILEWFVIRLLGRDVAYRHTKFGHSYLQPFQRLPTRPAAGPRARRQRYRRRRQTTARKTIRVSSSAGETA